MTLLNPWFWLFLVASWLGAAFGGYEYAQKGIEEEHLASQAALEAANKHSQEVSDERNTAVSQISSDLAAAQAKAEKASKDLRYNITSGALRLSVPVTSCGNVSNNPTATSGNNEARAELDPEAAERIVVITDDGNKAINKLNACIDAYNSLTVDKQ